MMEDNLSIIEITGGLLKAGIEYTSLSNTLLIQRGGVITLWNLNNDDSKIIRTFRQVHQMKLFKSGKYFILAYILFDGIEIELYESLTFHCIKQRKILIDIKGREYKEINIINIFMSFISKDEMVIVIKGDNKQNWLFKLNIERLTCNLQEAYIGLFKSKVKNVVVLQDNPQYSNTFITANSKAIYYWVYNSNTKEINSVNKIVPKIELIYASLTICDSSSISCVNCIVGILTKTGECLIYDMSANCKEILDNEKEHFTHLSMDDGIIILGCSDGKIYVYDQLRIAIKYIINTKEEEDGHQIITTQQGIFKVFLYEEKDILIIIRLNGTFEYHNLSSILRKNKQQKTIPLIEANNHSDNIIAIEWLNEPPLTFYTSSINGHLIKWHYRGDKWISESFPLQNDIFISCLKLHPQYNNYLYATNNQGTMLQIDLSSHDTNNTSFHIANFPIELVSFNKGNLAAFGFQTGMIMIYTLDFNSKCDFCVKIIEDYIDETKASQKKISNCLTSFVHFLNCTDKNSLIIRSGINSIALVGINRINNTMITTIDDELEYDTNDDIIDITIHPSEKYMFVLLDSKQINIKEIGTWRNIGVIDVLPKLDSVQSIAIDYTGTFISVLGSNIKGSMKSSNILLYDIKSGDVINETGEMFTISKHILSTDGRFIIATGIDGTMTIIKLTKAIKERIYNVYDLMMINQNKFWNKYDIEYPMKRRILRKSTSDNFTPATGTGMNNNEQKSIIKDHNKTKDSIDTMIKKNNDIPKATNINNNQIQLKTEDLKEQLLTNINKDPNNTRKKAENNNKNDNISNYINVNPTQKYNTIGSFNTHRQLQSNMWNKQKQYSRLALTNSNTFTMNKNPNLFSSNSPALLQKVNQNYLNSQSLSYPPITRNLIETSSKNQQDEIRYNNITKAIQVILTQEEEEKAKEYKGKNHPKFTNSNRESSMSILNTQHTKTTKSKLAMNKDYYINNQSTKQSKMQHLPDPEGIDNLSIMIDKNKNPNTQYSNSQQQQNNNTSINQISREDISFISTVTNNGKLSVADDIDYIYDNIERFEHHHKGKNYDDINTNY